MKPHLPVRLLRAVVLMMAAAPAALYAEYTAPTEIVVPEGYTESNTPEITNKDTNTAYRLTGDATMTPAGAAFNSGASYLYTSDSADELSSISFTNPTGATNQAFSVSTEVNFDSLKDVSFSAFSSPWQHGGAIYVGATGNLNFSNNYSIKFNSNSLKTAAFASNGGAIDVEGASSFSNNHEVIFDNNSTLSNGGAVCIYKFGDANPSASFSGNDIVKFTNNYTRNQSGGLGGAISMSGGQLELTDNTELTFDANKAQSTYLSQGGAIRASDGTNTIDISHNGDVSFTNNQSVCSGTSANGGAITAIDTALTINNNDSLIFSGNKVQVSTGTITKCEGGALFVGGNSSLQMQNNTSVIFEDNKTQVGNTVKYNGLHAADSVVEYNPNNPSQYRTYIYELDVEISAAEEGSVEFRDCAFIDVSQNANSSFQLNSTYTGEDGKEIAQTGDIIFTGAYMTSGDKTSEFKGTASLHDGRLVVKEGAVLKADNLVVAESASGESSPTLVVDNATVTTNKLSFGAGTTLESNNGTISSTEGITVNGGTVKGSGTFCALTMNGGELIVGNSPGVQTYEGDVELNDTVVTFSLSDLTTPATEELMGWEAKAYSVIDMNGHNLTIGDGVSFVFEVGGQALAQLIDPNSEESFSFELELIRNVDTLTLDNKTIEELIADSEFVITSDEEGLLDGRYEGWAGMNITEHITSAFYTEEDGTVVLNVTMTAVPEPTTATLSLLALAGLAMRRRRK